MKLKTEIWNINIFHQIKIKRFIRHNSLFFDNSKSVVQVKSAIIIFRKRDCKIIRKKLKKKLKKLTIKLIIDILHTLCNDLLISIYSNNKYGFCRYFPSWSKNSRLDFRNTLLFKNITQYRKRLSERVNISKINFQKPR